MNPKSPNETSHEEQIAFRDAERAMGRQAMRLVELFDAIDDVDAADFFSTADEL
jgi:hypothetical protein